MPGRAEHAYELSKEKTLKLSGHICYNYNYNYLPPSVCLGGGVATFYRLNEVFIDSRIVTYLTEMETIVEVLTHRSSADWRIDEKSAPKFSIREYSPTY